MTSDTYRLTQYSHGAGCGCKIAPDVLDRMLAGSTEGGRHTEYPNLLVGNSQRDDAAAYAIDGERVVLSTTDFFMPIVDDPFDFGRIAATNAISDIYAMGGQPMMAIAILGWPVDKLPPEVAGKVIAGGRAACQLAGMPLAGGHSIDAPEPIFGLAVTGSVATANLKRNSDARPGDRLFLTKALGIGILTTAEKQARLDPKHARIATDTMCQLNDIGMELAAMAGVNAMTDVTGFGLMGHLLELCDGSDLQAVISPQSIASLPGVDDYIAAGCIPGGSNRNFSAYGHRLPELSDAQRCLLCDPQTSGGLLISVTERDAEQVARRLQAAGLPHLYIGYLRTPDGSATTVLLDN